MNQSQTQSRPATLLESFVAKLLDPVDRLVEAIYSVLIVLTFTLAYRLAEKNAALGPQAAANEVSQLLYGMGYRWGQFVGAIPWKTGLALLLVGLVMVGIALLLGG